MLWLLGASVLAILVAQAAVVRALSRSLPAGPPAPAAQSTQTEAGTDRPADKQRKGVSRAEFDKYALAVEALALKVDQLPRIWTEEADRAFRSAERAEKAGRRSRAKRSDEAQEPDDRQLSLVDGDRGAEGGLPPLHRQVASPPDAEAIRSEVRRDLAFSTLGKRH